MASLDLKVLKKKKIDKELTLKVSRNESSERIFVEFSSKDGKIVLQKSFQDNFYGHRDAEVFENSIKNIDALKAYFKLK